MSGSHQTAGLTTRIVGLGSHAPERVVTNDDLSKMVDNFELFFRAEKGQIVCQVESPKALNEAERKQVYTIVVSQYNTIQ